MAFPPFRQIAAGAGNRRSRVLNAAAVARCGSAAL